MSKLLEKSGTIVFLRAHDLGTAYGPPNDQLDVEAVFILNAIGDGAYGFQLRNDDKLPARQALFSLVRDAFVDNLPVTTDYFIDPGKMNGVAIRVALTRKPLRPTPPVALNQAVSGQVLPTPSVGAKSKAKSATASKKQKARKSR